MTAMRKQLVDLYLTPIGRRHGIYLVYWTTPSQRPAGMSRATWPDAGELKHVLANQAAELRKSRHDITPFVLDVSYKQSS